MKNAKSFTLIELLISISIFAVIMVTLFSAFRTGIFGLSRIEESALVSETGYIALSRIDKDLRNSFAYSPDDSKFTGKKDSLSFLTLNPNFAYVNYYFSGNKLLRLVRINKDALKTDSETKPKVLAKDVKQIEFVYLYIDPATNKFKETDTWNGASALPSAVRVKLVSEKKEEALFVRTIYLP